MAGVASGTTTGEWERGQPTAALTGLQLYEREVSGQWESRVVPYPRDGRCTSPSGLEQGGRTLGKAVLPESQVSGTEQEPYQWVGGGSQVQS